MQDFVSPIDDILWTLNAGAGAQRLKDWDAALAQEVVQQAARFIDAEIAPLDRIAESQPPQLRAGRVILAAPFVSAYQKYAAEGWPGICTPEAYGGQALPHVLGCVVSELLSGSCLGFQTVLSLGQGATRTLLAHGSEEQRSRVIPRLNSGEWLATMCLTEPTAGSDLSQIRTTASPADDGSWRIEGTKIFISGGDQNLTSNIMHLVLARTPEAPPGIRGLALFLCPAELPDGERNSMSVLRLEEKMGLHASPTCQMTFEGARAEMLGGPGEGLARMFTMMNATRLDVATEGVGLAQVAAQRSWAYAVERRQGRSAESDESVDLICSHADVQRMLMTQRALVLGIRALVYRTMVTLELGDNAPLIEFLTPVCKAYATEAAVECANLAIQIHGGYGYCREYRVEQILRDARITCIYEGTNGIQAMTLAGRLLKMHDGACAEAFATDIENECATAQENGQNSMARELQVLLDGWRVSTELVRQCKDPGLCARDYLQLTGLIALAATWSRLERAASEHPSPNQTLATAKFVRERILPQATTLEQVIRNAATGSSLTSDYFTGMH